MIPVPTHPIYILEGPDGSGKTTLAERMVELLGARYIHLGHRFVDNMFEYHTAAIEIALRESMSRPVVIDRWWPSEIIYSSVFRGGSRWPHMGRMLDRVALKQGVTYVDCLPSDEAAYFARFEKLRESGREMFDTMSGIRSEYASHFQTCAHRHDHVSYDLDRDGSDVDTYVRYLESVGRGNIDQLGSKWRSLDLRTVAGNPNGIILAVCDHEQIYRRNVWPGFGQTDTHDEWCARLNEEGLGEDELAWVKSSNHDVVADAIDRVQPGVILTLGPNSAQAVYDSDARVIGDVISEFQDIL